AVRNPDGSFAQPTPVSGVNTRWHDGPAAITRDGGTMYFSSESFVDGEYEKEKVNKDRLKKSQIWLYRATKSGGGWDKVVALPFNSKEFNTGNPAISKDGKTLYFASNRPGSMGGTDIWKVEITDQGTYGEPQNLGSAVNTEGEENFPYVTDQDQLYFASQGRRGFGGYDVFVIDLKGGTPATNVGAPVNGPRDDFAFTYNDTKKIGFFS